MTGPLTVLISTPSSMSRIVWTDVNELRQALIQEWDNIPQAEINTLVNSMRRQCTAVVNSRVGHTRY